MKIRITAAYSGSYSNGDVLAVRPRAEGGWFPTEEQAAALACTNDYPIFDYEAEEVPEETPLGLAPTELNSAARATTDDPSEGSTGSSLPTEPPALEPITPGRYRMRNGRDARVENMWYGLEHPARGFADDGAGGDESTSWTLGGAYSIEGALPGYDLVARIGDLPGESRRIVVPMPANRIVLNLDGKETEMAVPGIGESPGESQPDVVVEANLTVAQHAVEGVAYRIDAPQPDADGWIPWAGGDCTISPGLAVDVRFRAGDTSSGLADDFSWLHDGTVNEDSEIVAYRLVEPAQVTHGDAVHFTQEGLNDMAGAMAGAAERRALRRARLVLDVQLLPETRLLELGEAIAALIRQHGGTTGKTRFITGVRK